MYDELGAMAIADVLFSKDMIVFHPMAKEASRQVSSWIMEDGKPAKGFPMCRAFLLGLSELNRVVKFKKVVEKPKDYATKIAGPGGQKIEEPKKGKRGFFAS